MIQPLQHASEEAAHDELGRLLRGNASGHHVEEFVLVKFPGGRAVGAADIVGEDLKTGHGVGLGLITQHEVPHLLVGIGLMSPFLDLDQTGKNGPGGVRESVVVEKVARGTRSVVILESPLVDLAIPCCGIDREHDASGSLAEEMAVALAADIPPAEIHLKGRGGGVLGDLGRVDVEGRRPVTPLLDTGIGQPRPLSEGQIVDRDRE